MGSRPFSRAREAAVGGNESLQHRHDQPDWIAELLPGFAGVQFGIGDEVAVQRGRDFDRHLCRR